MRVAEIVVRELEDSGVRAVRPSSRFTTWVPGGM